MGGGRGGCLYVWRVGVRRLVVYSSRKMIGEKKEQQQAADAIWLTVCAVAEDNFHPYPPVFRIFCLK